ncbi:hypothetical protein MMC24_000253 [Lignoscripta atroalba]|nr:hypothetical protein [Lignoscripta atroalba]
MVSRKRGRAEMESSEPAAQPDLLTRLRNMWEFANIMQYIFIFGKAVKIDDDFDIEDLEAECLKSGPSDKLAELGLALLKFVSSHRGLTPEIFDEYTRRQYVAKAPARNPFGTEEIPNRFADFDIFTKLRVLFQLSQWTLINAERMRERMPETKDTEQTQWRIEELGYDRDGRLYFVLDDNRLYRRTDPPPPPPPALKPKSKSKKGKAAARASKRRKIVETDESADDVEDETAATTGVKDDAQDDGFGGRNWECIAITLGQYQDFLETIRKTRDADEKMLFNRLMKEVLPVIEKAADDQQKKIARRERELLNMQKLATAKRSTRIASKMDRERDEQEAAEAERKKQADLVAAKKELERQRHMEEARESRMMTREQRLKEREYKRLLHEEELANLSEDSKKLETGEARMSERHLKAEMEKTKKELDKLAQEDEWVFDCSKCGVHGENLDDGSHSVACEKCNVWQHSACLGISQAAAEEEDFHFVCDDCKRREEDAKKPKIPALKFRIGSSASPPSDKTTKINGSTEQLGKRKYEDETIRLPPIKKFKHIEVPAPPTSNGTSPGPTISTMNSIHNSVVNGPKLSPQGQLPSYHGGHNIQSSPNRGPDSSSPSVAYTNGYPPSMPNTNGQVSRYRSEASQHSPAVANGLSQLTQGTPGCAAANRYPSSYHPPYPPQSNQHQFQFAHTTQNPFLNSFDRQRPSSSHSNHHLPSPMKNRPSMTPTQGNRDVRPLVYPQTNTANGAGLSSDLHSATHPSSYTTLTVSSPPASAVLASSSPVMAAPNQSQYGPMSGLSPSKHVSPRPASSHSVSGTPVMPPVTQLSPSPQMQNLHAPVKGLMPQQARITNGQVNEGVNGD